jgi:hypothetical protein
MVYDAVEAHSWSQATEKSEAEDTGFEAPWPLQQSLLAMPLANGVPVRKPPLTMCR